MANRETMTISLPPEMREWIDRLVESGGYASVSEYLRELVRVDSRKRLQDEVSQILLDSISSGPGKPITPEFWDSIRSDVRRQLEARRGKKQAG